MQIRELMGRATLARVRGDKAQALKLAQEALVLNEQNAEVHEFIGDVLMELGRGGDALGSYKRARELNPNRVELEDKVARAAVRRAAYQDQMAYMNAVLEGRAPQEHKRKPSYSALLSLVLPGLGQYYNGQVGKALVVLGAFLLLSLMVVWAGLRRVASGGGVYAAPSYTDLLAGAWVWLALLAALYIYAIADAALVASASQGSDKSGLV